MEDYSNSLKEINHNRKANRNEKLTKLKMREYGKVKGKLSWLAQGTRPDLSFTALQMSKKNNMACGLVESEQNLENDTSKESKMFSGSIAKKEELQIVGIDNTTFKTNEKAVEGVVLVIVN